MGLKFDSQFGLVRRGVIDTYNGGKTGIIIESDQNIGNASVKQQTQTYAPYPLALSNGLMIFAKPTKGTPVSVQQGEGNEGYINGFLPQGRMLNLFPAVEDNELVISGSVNNYIKVRTDNIISIGNKNDYIKITTPSKLAETLISSSIDNEFKISQSQMLVSGIIRREQSDNYNYVDSSKLMNDDYNSELKIICMDNANNMSFAGNNRKNPALVESRTVTFEMAVDSNIENDLIEAANYDVSKQPQAKALFNDRRNTRANALNLNIYNPNALIEEIKGTVVDVFGNILDGNRNVINLNNHISDADSKTSFIAIKEQERTSIAYHMEINSRKDPKSSAHYDSSDNFGRARSNFSFDVDKEGMFKMNLPATSESGTVPLALRYLNKSATSDNPNKLAIDKDDNRDILIDGFGIGVIPIRKKEADITPIDRLTNEHIKYGTVYHDITKTGFAIQNPDFMKYPITGQFTYTTTDIAVSATKPNEIPSIKSMIKSSLTSGIDTGGRSGFISSDGSLDVNIGANTSDKQSLILDTQGGIVGNIGRDKRNVSMSLGLDGALLIQVGGPGVSGDSRFKDEGIISGIVDLRVVGKNGRASQVRIDDTGVTIISQTDMRFHSAGDMTFTSDSKIQFDSEVLVFQNREVKKGWGGSI